MSEFAARWNTASKRCIGEQRLQAPPIQHIEFDEMKSGIASRCAMLRRRPSCKLSTHQTLAPCCEQAVAKMAADEAGPAGHQSSHPVI